MTEAEASYLLADGEPVQVSHHGEELRLSAGQPQKRPIPVLKHRPRPSQPPGRAPIHRKLSEDSS